MTFREIIKKYFETGDFPTQAQFYEFFDKIYFKDEGVSRIEGVGMPQFNLPAGTWVDKIGIVAPGEITVNCGTLVDGNDVIDNETITGTEGFDRNVYFPDGGALYFSGITVDTKILIFTR